MPHPLDADAVRRWCGLALEALGRAREEIDAINVYPVADGDTGTNLYLTVESAAQAVEAAFNGHAVAAGPARPSRADVLRAMAHGALIGACGNSGTILAQLLRGMTDVLTAAPTARHHQHDASPPVSAVDPDGAALRRALLRAAESARQAVAHPVEGTLLTVAAAAAEGAIAECGPAHEVALAAHRAAGAALDATPGQLDALARAGVVDAGGYGLVTVLGALSEALTGLPPDATAARHGTVERPARAESAAVGREPAFEVTYLLETEAGRVARLRSRLDALGDSLVIVGGDQLWHVHVHVQDAGAAVEAGIQVGRPYRIRISALPETGHHGRPGRVARPVAGSHCGPPRRAVVTVLPGAGLADLCAGTGATVVPNHPGEPPASGELVEAILHAGAGEAVLLPNAAWLRHTAAVAAERARTAGVRVSVIPTRSPVQGIAALAVHEPGRRFDEDVVAMTSAAGATRHAELAVAEHRSWTMAGVCQAGDVLGLIDGDVAVIGGDLTETARVVLERMLASGGEMVTLVLGAHHPPDLGERLEHHVREHHLAVDTVVYDGGQVDSPLLIGVE